MNRQHFLVLALLVSVGVNLLIAGIVIGRSGTPREGPPPIAWAAQNLQPETRQLVRLRMRDQQSRVRLLRKDMQKATRAVRAAVSAADYKPQALSKALADWRAASQRYQQFIHDNLVEVSSDLPTSERVALLRAAMLRGPANGAKERSPRQGR